MTTITPARTTPISGRSPVTRFIVRHPIAAFLIGAYVVGGPLLTIFTTASSLPVFVTTVVGLAFTYVALLGSALTVTWVIGGRAAVVRFMARFLQWRFGVTRWLYIVLALPSLTIVFAALSGTLQTPAGGWSALAISFLLQTFVYGALEVNVAEEGAWSGLVQTRLADRHGILGGALRTAPPFVAMHLPLQFAPGWTVASVALGVAVLIVMAPFFRYLIGETLYATGGSLLAVGILHAAFNASGQMGFPGGWQFLAALIVLSVTVGLVRRFRRAAPKLQGPPISIAEPRPPG
jgi:membrane protease YdiL (CAAX protease family)